MKSFLSAQFLLLPSLALAGYTLQDDYNPSNFFSKFNVFTGPDPTQGHGKGIRHYIFAPMLKLTVKFVDQSSGLMTSSAKSVKMLVDTQNKTPGGRPAVRIESKATYSSGLIVADIAHMPGSICGVWPAFWTLGPDWPSHGEIDIIEGVNTATTNAMTLHTSPGCSIKSGNMLGSIKTSNCDVNAAGQGNNVGCGIGASGGATYGDPFNAAGGGVYATNWNDQAISIYFFTRSQIPDDITSGNPNPATWGEPMATFSGGCNIAQSFQNHSLVFDTTFCGDWAGGVWGSDPVCSKKAATCNDYVSNNPQDFTEAYWEVNSVKVYQSNGASNPLPGSSVGTPKATGLPVGSGIPTPAPSASISDMSPGGGNTNPKQSKTHRHGRPRQTTAAAIDLAAKVVVSHTFTITQYMLIRNSYHHQVSQQIVAEPNSRVDISDI